ncbi:Gfo/Idh/MocA family protein [Motilimonas pumila]|uniref:Gfo/Idh/MocA family oxidoreductase n=1 Tax=Motilimonas pumila TaxID=2303987 RepID=A0A418YKM9_9GAMM|nr:Gfo/Idh/MocA family oxidoreductase [Motilimonas pumila]RJG51509.1 gfo/Idh/MocA family oxidoreductase [Motilimonas pumila]
MPQTNDTQSIVVVGLGDIAQKAWLPLICQHPDISPIFCTRNPDTLSRLAKQYRVSHCYQDYQQALATAPDAVMIHSATSSHFALASQAISLGIATFVDKPLADNFMQCQQLAALAKAHNVPLFTGFNRRYAPLLQPLKAQPLQQLQWQKHRHDLVGNVRDFIFDDFIHVIDSLLHYSHTQSMPDLSISYRMQQDSLAQVQIQWQQGGMQVSGVMNRTAGHTFERVEAFAHNQYWQLDNLRQGFHSQENRLQPIGFDDWQPTLTKRGFNALLADWLNQVKHAQYQPKQLDSMLLSHQVAELLVQHIESHNI